MKIEIDPKISVDWQDRIERLAMLELGSTAAELTELNVSLIADFNAGESPVYICRVAAWHKRGDPLCIEMRHREPGVCATDAFARLRRQLQRPYRHRLHNGLQNRMGS